MICAIVLAAGRSRRMGGAHKMLLPFGTTTVIGRVADELARSAVERIYVVVGFGGDRVREELVGRRAVRFVDNPDYDAGMLSSVRCGLRALPDDCEGVVIALGDQPRISSATVDELVRAFKAGRRKTRAKAKIFVPVHGGKRGHPLLLSTEYRAEILERYDDVGLRGLLHAHPDEIGEVAAASDAVLSDMDVPEDYERERGLV